MEWTATGHPDGTISLGKARERIRTYLKGQEHPIRLKIVHELPESTKLRRFFHGAVLPLWAYLDGRDYRDSAVCRDYAEAAKVEFNGIVLTVNGKPVKVGRSTRGSAILGPHVERVITYLEENYAIDRSQCLNPDDYKHFESAVLMHGQYETFIDYLVELNRIPRVPRTV